MIKAGMELYMMPVFLGTWLLAIWIRTAEGTCFMVSPWSKPTNIFGVQKSPGILKHTTFCTSTLSVSSKSPACMFRCSVPVVKMHVPLHPDLGVNGLAKV